MTIRNAIRLALAILTVTLSPEARSQCDVTTHDTEDGYVHISEYETLQRPTDMIDGWRIGQARLVFIDDRTPGGSRLVLSVAVAAYQQASLVPRGTRISFSGGPALTLSAETCGVEQIGGAVVEQCDYYLNGNDAVHFGRKDIRSFSIMDQRQGLTMDATPTYAPILKEQFACLSRASLARP